MHHPFQDGPEDALDRAAEVLASASEVAVLTGAGVSAESGLATFRDADGLWEGHRVEDVATPSGFRRDPAQVWRFYHARRASLRQASPNPGHRALVALEERFGARFTLATQNVDGLHGAAGSHRLLELHGNLRRVRCTECDWAEDRGTDPLPDMPRCGGCGALLRPDVVWFEEPLPVAEWHEAKRAADRCDCFLVIGTSAVVYPAAGLIRSARYGGARVIEVNLRTTGASAAADVGLYGPSGELLPRLVERLK
jgi:NAD-dependent deacetylase